jgi:hypothetical protein
MAQTVCPGALFGSLVFLVELAESRRPALGPTMGMLGHRRWFHKGSGVGKS